MVIVHFASIKEPHFLYNACVCVLVIKAISSRLSHAEGILQWRRGSKWQHISAQETWTSYIERLEQYLAANKVEDADQHRAILLSVGGPATYRLIRNLASPKKPIELKFKDIVDLVAKHYDPKPSVIV